MDHARQLVDRLQRRHPYQRLHGRDRFRERRHRHRRLAEAGTLLLSGSALLDDVGNLFLQNGLEIVGGTTFALEGGHLGFPSSSIGATVDTGGLFEGYGSYQDPLVDNGTVEAEAGQKLELLGSLSGSGSLQIDNGATLNLPGDAQSGAGMTVDFNAGVATPGTLLELDEPGSFTGPTLDGLNFGDTILMGYDGATLPSYSISGSTVTISAMDFGSPVSASFALGTVPAGAGIHRQRDHGRPDRGRDRQHSAGDHGTRQSGGCRWLRPP